LTATVTFADAGTIAGGLVVSEPTCTVTGTTQSCEWSLSGVADVAPGVYTVSIDDDDLGSTSAVTIDVAAEDAEVVFDEQNPVAVQVTDDGGTAGVFTLDVSLVDADDGFPGDIDRATLEVTLQLVGPGSPVTGTCTPDGGGDWSCDFGPGVSVNTYTVDAVVGGFCTGSGEDVVVVFDPSLGFTTGGGTYTDPGSGDRVNFGYTMKYNKKRTNVQGSLLVIRHTNDGVYRLKSNQVGFDWATFAGKATYKEPGEDAIGNYEFVAYVEDHATPGVGADRFWVTADRGGDAADGVSIAPDAVDNAVLLTGGNIVVPHQTGGGNK